MVGVKPLVGHSRVLRLVDVLIEEGTLAVHGLLPVLDQVMDVFQPIESGRKDDEHAVQESGHEQDPPVPKVVVSVLVVAAVATANALKIRCLLVSFLLFLVIVPDVDCPL